MDQLLPLICHSFTLNVYQILFFKGTLKIIAPTFASLWRVKWIIPINWPKIRVICPKQWTIVIATGLNFNRFFELFCYQHLFLTIENQKDFHLWFVRQICDRKQIFLIECFLFIVWLSRADEYTLSNNKKKIKHFYCDKHNRFCQFN